MSLTFMHVPGMLRLNIAHNRPEKDTMPGYANPGFDTLALHAGAAPDPAPAPGPSPIHLTTSFVFESSEHAASLFNMERSGPRLQPDLEPDQRGARGARRGLEGGAGRSPPPAARRAAPGDRDHRRRRLAHRRVERALRRLAQPAALHAVALRHLDELRQARRLRRLARGDPAGTRLLFGETLGNPGLDVLDIPTCRAIAHENDLPLLVDSTFTTPWLMKPFEHGADLLYTRRPSSSRATAR
jgi:O-acetylhomoserine (thiol)-lyase